MTYIVIFLVGALLIGAGYAWYAWTPNTTAPAGGATTPPAGTMWTRTGLFTTTHAAELVTVAGIMVIIILVALLFPPLWSVVVATLGWPLLATAAVMLTLAIIFLTGKSQILIAGVIIAILAIALSPALWNLIPQSAPVQTAQAQTVRQVPHDPCDGNYRPLVIGPSAVLATPGGRNCMIDFDVREGGVILIGLNGEEFGRPVTKDQPAGRSDFRVIEWKSAGTSAKLNVRYYR